MPRFAVTARKGHQYNIERVDATQIAAHAALLASRGFAIENIERCDREAANVRFDVDGMPIQYADAADASEHELRIAESGGWEPTEHYDPRNDTFQCEDDYAHEAYDDDDDGSAS